MKRTSLINLLKKIANILRMPSKQKDDDYENEQDREEIVKAWEMDAYYFEEMISRIKIRYRKA